jgi:xylulokinase
MAELFLGVDLGTGGCKLTIVDVTKGVIGEYSKEYVSHNPHPGWSEQDPADWMDAFYSCFASLRETTEFDPRDIRALCPDASTHNAVLLDENDKVLRRCIMWNDQRSFAEARWLNENHGKRLFEITFQKASPTWTLPQLLWVRNTEPELFAKIRRIAFTKDYLRYLITGVWSTEYVDAGGSMLMDFPARKWSAEACEILGLPLSALPPIGAPADIVGYVLPEVARRMGLNDRVQVIAGASDTCIEDLAAGVLRAGQCIVKLATAGNFNVFTDKPAPNPFSFCYNYVVPGLYYATMGTNAAAASFRWFRDNVVRRVAPGMVFNDIEKFAHEAPPGSEGVIYHPDLNGERAPYFDPHLRANFFGLSSFHDLRHMTRAVLEGVAYSLKDCMKTASSVGLVPDEVRLIGGGGKSPLWCQIVADALDRPVIKLKSDDSSLGSAMLAGVGSGAFADFAEAVRVCSVVDHTYAPLPENVGRYDEMFAVYKDIQANLAPLHARMHGILQKYA